MIIYMHSLGSQMTLSHAQDNHNNVSVLEISQFCFYSHLFFFLAILFLTYFAQDFAQDFAQSSNILLKANLYSYLAT